MALSLLFGGVEFALSALWYGAKSAYGVATYVSSTRSQQTLNARLEGIERRLDMLLDERDSVQRDAQFIGDALAETIDSQAPDVLFDERIDMHASYTNSIVIVSDDEGDDAANSDNITNTTYSNTNTDNINISNGVSDNLVPEITPVKIPIIYGIPKSAHNTNIQY